jgi:hypothetical protein
MNGFWEIAARRTAKKEELSAWSDERLEVQQHARFNPHRPNREKVVSFMQIRPRQQFLEPRRGHISTGQPERPDGFA